MSSRYTVDLDGRSRLVDDQPPLYFKIWDLGPKEPMPPKKPDLPKGKEGEPEHDLAMIEFRGALAVYEAELIAYGKAKKDFADWHQRYGGPYQIEWLSPDAREALANDRLRYVEKLPKGVKPGKYQHEQTERAEQAKRDLQTLAARDPVFGNQGASL